MTIELLKSDLGVVPTVQETSLIYKASQEKIHLLREYQDNRSSFVRVLLSRNKQGVVKNQKKFLFWWVMCTEMSKR